MIEFSLPPLFFLLGCMACFLFMISSNIREIKKLLQEANKIAKRNENK